ncbi:Ig-like domain-containing protein [Mycobacterium sp. 1274756.6]|uniref:L,D-transpeptidase n=1 Tax=Mycobacterium sp. 1274756.6 TaxID=1834076 RepID=UPI0009ED4B8B|nr:Ig-like domain-containing protein [Mycobacterium sp. 1274756.6]
MSVGSAQRRRRGRRAAATTLAGLALVAALVVTASRTPARVSAVDAAAIPATPAASATSAPPAVPATQASALATANPGRASRVGFATTSGADLVDGGTYGVGTVIVAAFDEPVTDRRAAESRLSVATDPPVAGSWYWMDGQHAHWRPQEYYRPGTRIVANADSYGNDLAGGTYGDRDSSVAFRIGDSHISIADDATKQIEVYDNGELVRTIPTSMGMGGTETFGGTTISFWTQPGVYTVMDKSESVVMDSSTYGLPIDSPSGYQETVNNAVRLTNSGIYVHQLDSTIWAQGNTNVSHGCLNVNGDHARWFYEFSRPGDVFEVRNTGGNPLPVWQNGDWSVPWDEWLAGSALAG